MWEIQVELQATGHHQPNPHQCGYLGGESKEELSLCLSLSGCVCVCVLSVFLTFEINSGFNT